MTDDDVHETYKTIYNRYQLITMKQQQLAQTIDSYLQQLKTQVKTCNFQAVSTKENKKQYMQDAFININTSPSIWQCLLEKPFHSLQEVYEIARLLEKTEKQSVYYEQDNLITTPIISSDENTNLVTIKKKKKKKKKKQ